MSAAVLSRTDASTAVQDTGWRYLLGSLAASVPVGSSRQGIDVAAAAVRACDDLADAHLRTEVRSRRVELTLQDAAANGVTSTDTDLAARITDAVHGLGLEIAAPDAGRRPVQQLELAIDAMDIAAVRPFWAAVLGYEDEPAADEPQNGLVDPARILPTVWFQEMDAPRPQRNRIHLDITVAHDEAQRRLRAALDAGGVLVSDAAARSFWILADLEGNEICICTWQDRDDRGV